MKTLIPITSNNNRTLNAIVFNDTDSSILATLIAGTELPINVPDGATLVRIVSPANEIVYISNTAGITLPVAGNTVNENAEINPAIRILPANDSRTLYAISGVELTLGFYFYNE